jgi:hypothetical protein
MRRTIAFWCVLVGVIGTIGVVTAQNPGPNAKPPDPNSVKLIGNRAELKRSAANTGAVTLIQRFGSAANLNIHLHCLVLDGVYRKSTAIFHEVAAPTVEELQALLAKIITRIMRLLTKHGFLIEEQDRTYLAEADRESALLPLQAASCTYRIALGPRAGQKVLSLQSVPSADKSSTPDLCTKLHGFTLHAAVECGIKSYRTASHQKRISRPTDLELLYNKKVFQNRRLASVCFHDVSMNRISQVTGAQSPKADSRHLS